ncbi:MAG: PQQ-dependent sugar dehydrogenase [Mycobacteriales bacterium]
MSRRSRARAGLAGALVALLLPIVSSAAPALAASSGPAGFSDSLVVSVPNPTGIAWTPDGRMLLTQDNGQVRVVRNGVLKATPALALGARVCTGGERGLSSIAVDPVFPTNHYVYLFWSFNKYNDCGTTAGTTPPSRVARYVLGDNDIIAPATEKVIVDGIASPSTTHLAGDLHFGADGLLYISTGDGGCTIGDPTKCASLNTNSRRMDIANGKILRVTSDGTIPVSNPYASAPGARHCTDPAGVPAGTGPCAETFASGFRNPYRFAQRPGTSNFLVNDVGQANWEEIDDLVAGKDYGWNVREGHCATDSTTDCGPTTFENPIFDYSHADGCGSITGGAFVPDGVWPAPYSGSYLFADFVCGGIFRLAPNTGGGYDRVPFFTGVLNPNVIAFGPYGVGSALYYLNYFGGEVHRIAYTSGANTAPVASFTHRPNGLKVTLDGGASYDPDSGDAVRKWSWKFGDGKSATTVTPTVTHTYGRKKVFTATLQVTDSNGAVSPPVTRKIYAGEHAPVIKLTAPVATARFAVGDVVPLSATATDAEDGTLAPGALTWTVLLNHNTHQHPYLGPVTGRTISPTYPSPEDVAAADTSYLIVSVTARDSRGLTTSVVFNLLPRKVTLTFGTSPVGGTVQIRGIDYLTPTSITAWHKQHLLVAAPDQDIGGTPMTFASWSDGGAQSHDLVVPSSATSYTAAFS